MKVLCDIQCELYHEHYPTGNKLKVTFVTKCLYFKFFKKVIKIKIFFLYTVHIFNNILQETTSTQRSRAERKLRERTQ